jgi:hypothetical protein
MTTHPRWLYVAITAREEACPIFKLVGLLSRLNGSFRSAAVNAHCAKLEPRMLKKRNPRKENQNGQHFE